MLEMLELRAARCRARPLAPIYNWFTDGFHAKDLNEAKALLEELGEELG